MELKYLYTLKKILEAGSFQKAAQNLNYTQSTITFQVQQLEQEFSVKLFERIGRKMVLTQAGHDLLPYIDTILESYEQIKNYGKETSEITGTLKIAMAETILTYRMQPVLKKFKEQAQNVRLSLQALSCFEIRNQIINGGVDIGIHYDVGGYSSAIITEILTSYNVSLIASPSLPKEYYDFISPTQRKPISLIINEPNNIYQQLFNKYLKDKNIVFDNMIELGSIEAIKRSVISNLGITFLPRFTVEDELSDFRLKEIHTELENEKIPVICAYHKNKWISPAMNLFLKLVRENINLNDQ